MTYLFFASFSFRFTIIICSYFGGCLKLLNDEDEENTEVLAGRNEAEIILEEEENFEDPNAAAENVDQIDSEGVRKLDKLLHEIMLLPPYSFI